MEFDYFWFVAAVALIGFVRWLFEKLTGRGRPTPDDSDPSDNEDLRRRREEALRQQQRGTAAPGTGIDPNEEIRKFFEALGGQVAEPPPPPEATPKPQPQAQAQHPPQGARKVARSAPSPAAPPPLPKAKKPKLTEAEKKALEAVQQRQAAGQAALGPRGRRRAAVSAAAGPTDVRHMLANRQTLRSAVLLREILGPPKALE